MPVKETIMVKLCIHVPKEQADKMHALVECGEYPADAEVYREAVRNFLEHRKSMPVIQSEGEPCPATT